MMLRILSQLADALGWHSVDDLSDFFACGISVLPLTLIAEGEPAAAGVALIVLICALICCSLLSGASPREFEAEVRAKERAEEHALPPDRRP